MKLFALVIAAWLFGAFIAYPYLAIPWCKFALAVEGFNVREER
jgi:hypothetical protein